MGAWHSATAPPFLNVRAVVRSAKPAAAGGRGAGACKRCASFALPGSLSPAFGHDSVGMARKGTGMDHGLPATVPHPGTRQTMRRGALRARLPVSTQQEIASAPRVHGRRRQAGARFAEPVVDRSPVELSAAGLPVQGEAEFQSVAGVDDVPPPADTSLRDGSLIEDYARPDRSLSSYAASGLLLSPPRHVGEDSGMNPSARGRELLGHELSDDDVPLQRRMRAASAPRCSASAEPGASAGFPPWTAPETGDPSPLSMYGSQLPSRRARSLLLGSPRSPERRQQVLLPPPVRKHKRTKKVKTTEEKLDTLSADLKALTKEWTACKGELVTVRTMLTTLTGQVHAVVETGGHVLNVVQHIADKPSKATLPVDAAPVPQPRPQARPWSCRTQARMTMRWFKPLKEAFMSRYRIDTLEGMDMDTVYRGGSKERALMIEVVMSHERKTYDDAKLLLDTKFRFHSWSTKSGTTRVRPGKKLRAAIPHWMSELKVLAAAAFYTTSSTTRMMLAPTCTTREATGRCVSSPPPACSASGATTF